MKTFPRTIDAAAVIASGNIVTDAIATARRMQVDFTAWKIHCMVMAIRCMSFT